MAFIPRGDVAKGSMSTINYAKKFGKKNSIISNHHKNIASALQKVFEEIYINIIIQASKKTKSKNLTLSGGCALNCKANGLILSKTKPLPQSHLWCVALECCF